MSEPTVITHFPGQKVDEHLQLTGMLPSEFNDPELRASAQRLVNLIDAGYPDHAGKPHRAKSSTLYRVCKAFVAITRAP